MSYCRRYDRKHEVYMYMHVGGWIECCMCHLHAKRCNLGELHVPKKFLEHGIMPPDEKFFTRSEALKHLLAHTKRGHGVPQYAIERLRKEIKEEGDEVGK